MANWLENEEQKAAAKREADDRQKAAEKAALAQLTQFHTLCARVNRVRYSALSVDGLRTYAPQWLPASEENRGLKITTDGQESVFVDADIQYEKNGPSEILVRTACSIGELGSWAEPHMLQCIKWLLSETNDVRYSLPGREVLNGEAEIFIEYSEWTYNKGPDRIGVLLDGAKLGRGWLSLGKKPTKFRISPGRHELTATGSGLSASVQIDAPPYGVLFYRASFEKALFVFSSRLRLVPYSPEGGFSRPRLSQ